MVGIINFNGAELTLRTVAQVMAQDSGASRQVIVVDNGSRDDDYLRLTAGLGDSVRVVRLKENLGYAAACNAVARIAAGADSSLVWFLNNDVEMEADLLRILLDALEADATAGAVAPVTVDADHARTVLGAGVAITLWRGKVSHLLEGRSVDALPGSPFAVDAIEGAGPLIRVSTLRDIGCWDEGFFMYWEDAEWSVRATRSGHRLVVVPAARLRHSVAASSTAIARQALILRNRVRFVRIAAPRRLQPVFLVYFVLLWMPAYIVARLIPRYGIGDAWDLVSGALAWNARDAFTRRRWMIRRIDQVIPSLPPRI